MYNRNASFADYPSYNAIDTSTPFKAEARSAESSR